MPSTAAGRPHSDSPRAPGARPRHIPHRRPRLCRSYRRRPACIATARTPAKRRTDASAATPPDPAAHPSPSHTDSQVHTAPIRRRCMPPCGTNPPLERRPHRSRSRNRIADPAGIGLRDTPGARPRGIVRMPCAGFVPHHRRRLGIVWRDRTVLRLLSWSLPCRRTSTASVCPQTAQRHGDRRKLRPETGFRSPSSYAFYQHRSRRPFSGSGTVCGGTCPRSNSELAHVVDGEGAAAAFPVG